MEGTVRHVWWILRIGLGAIFVVAGADKFFNLLTYWPMYVSELFANMMPVSAQTFMHVAGIGEMLVGLAMLSKPRLGGYLGAAWMLAVALNLITAGLYDLASRDVAIALGALSLALLSKAVHAAQIEHRHLVQHPAHAGT